jgi:hypothetical protein
MREKYDIFISSGATHFADLKRLLPLLSPHGTVHLASTGLSGAQLAEVEAEVDVLSVPRHDSDPYENFKLFCIRDINRMAKAPWFIKLDTDVRLSDDWIEYVEECLAERPDAVFFGPHAGSNRIEYDISGPLVRRKLGADVRVRNGIKVNGSFYVARTAFFREHDHTMQVLHDLVYAFCDGRRIRRSHLGDEALERGLGEEGLVRMRGVCALRQGKASEDNLRSLAVHVVGASQHVFVRDAAGRIFLPDKARAPSGLKRGWKWVQSRAGIPWRSTKKREAERLRSRPRASR